MKKLYVLKIEDSEGKTLQRENMYLTPEQFGDLCRVIERAKELVSIEDSRRENGIDSEL